MKHPRDEQLGRALTSLDVPHHGEGFWDALADRLRAEGAERPRQTDDGAPVVIAPPGPQGVTHLHRSRAGSARSDQRWLASAAVAAVVALVVAAAVMLAGGPDQSSTAPVATTPTSADRPGTTDEPREAVPASLSAEITVTLEDGSERRFSLVAEPNGRRRVVALDSGELYVRDVPAAEDVVVFPPEDGVDPGAFRRRGVPAGGPNSRFVDPVSAPDLVAHALALVAADDPSVTEVEHLGRPAWRLETDVTPNAIGGGPDEATVVIDRATTLPLFVEERMEGQPVRTLEVTALQTSDEPADPDAFEVDGDAKVLDEGFERISIEALRAGAMGDAAVEPATVPDGFELASVDVHPGTGPSTGPEAVNPPSLDAVVLVYRRGWEELVVTSWRSGGDPDVWEDPYGGEGLVVEAEPTTIEGGALDGTDAEIVVDPATTPHVWGVDRELVITVSSTARFTPAQLREVAGSLERIG